jgi:DNA end-binding protein Ku
MARPIWTGSITFGLVSIPIEMYMAVHEKSVHFHMLNKDGTCRLRRKLVCPDSGKEYDFNQTAKGIEIGPEDYVLVDQKEIDRLKPEKGKSMEIVQFIEPGDIDPVYYDRVYYLRPGKDAKKPYKLLVAAMSESGKFALGRFVMRERQYTVMIRTMDQGMVLHTLHYADEVDPMDAELAPAMERIKLSSAEQRMAGELVKSMTAKLHLEEFKDEYRTQLQALIDAKKQGKEVSHAPEEEDRPLKPTINLMDALRRSLAAGASQRDGSRNSVSRDGSPKDNNSKNNGHPAWHRTGAHSSSNTRRSPARRRTTRKA